ASPRSLATAWTAKLDGAVYGQPLLVGDLLYAATENDTVYALDPASGAVRWSRHVGNPVPRADLPCGNIDPLGITSTMVYDPANRLVLALAETTGGHHTLFGLDATTGAVRLSRPAEPPKGNLLAHQQRSALTLLDGTVYVAYGGLFGDCGDYIGSVVAVPVVGSGALRTYAVPTSREAGIWASGGGTVQGDRLLYAVGNGESTSGYDGSDSVLALNADLSLADRFAPTTWPEDNAHDLDLGSMTPAVVGGYVFIAGKRGTGYVLRGDHFGGIGGQVSQADVCRAFGGAAVSGDTVFVPCPDGTRAVRVDSAGQIHVTWHTTAPADGSPVLGSGAVWVTDYRAGTLYTLDPATGAALAHLDVGGLPHFASPTLGRGLAFLGTLAGVTAVRSG
ncbi:MAG TPA: PQQ-binding-like beta-propeller repeat protein, partial [Rugosimonospora sp.]|nr:PQQ-binding-like beta-propeller repeat protein [Rugosimonospora sp.]